ncbi:Single-stranded DNA-binding protein [Sporomusa carbonis]|uniref:single-stranded DNA-binding protein n=1 Tax=Sporomusa carbonis TaxID=3076075 RepID=UPI003A6B3AA7
MNRFFLTGNLTADPTFTPGQEESKNRCNFRIAFNHNKDKATFFSCTAWGKTAERVSKLTKGQRVLVVGDIEENEWTDQQGQKQRDKQVNVREVEYIDFPPQNQQQPANQPPAPGYGAPPAGYQLSAGYPPASGYGAPPQGYGQPPQQYATPAPGYGQPPQQAPVPQYQQPPQQYAAPPVQPAPAPQQYAPPAQPYNNSGQAVPF